MTQPQPQTFPGFTIRHVRKHELFLGPRGRLESFPSFFEEKSSAEYRIKSADELKNFVAENWEIIPAILHLGQKGT